MANNKDRADYTCAAFNDALPALKIVEDIYAGTLQVRAWTTDYLPKNPAEDDTEYRARLKRSVFPPFFKRALGKLVGIVFGNDPVLKDAPDEFAAAWKDIDRAGTPGEVFAQNAMLNSAKDGFSLIYVDMPPEVTESQSLSPEPTAQDEAEAELAPFWVLYKRGQLVNWRKEKVDGRIIFTLAVLKEVTSEADGDFGEKSVVRYRVLRPGSWQLWRQEGRRAPTMESEGVTNLDYIPLFPTSEDLECDPPLVELAHLCVKHYQKQSDLDNILHIANVPILWARDRNLKVPFVAIGPTTLIDLQGEHAELGYAEHQGKAIGAAQQDIKDLKSDMAVAALQMLAEQTPGPATATGEIIDTAESNSELSLMVKSLQAALNNAKRAHAELSGFTDAGSIELQVEYDNLVLSVEEMRVLKEYTEDVFLSVESLLELLKRAGKLGKDFDVKQELVRLFGPDLADKPEIVKQAAIGPPASANDPAPHENDPQNPVGQTPPAAS